MSTTSGPRSSAWTLVHEARFAPLNDVLTELLPRLENATRDATGDDAPGDDAPGLHALRVRACQAASAAFARHDEPDAAWVAAGRAITAAELSGRPLAVIAGHFRLAHAFIRLGRFDHAEQVTASAIDVLAPTIASDATSPQALSLYGAMHLVHAVISGHESDRTQARAHLAEATRTAERLAEDRNAFDTESDRRT